MMGGVTATHIGRHAVGVPKKLFLVCCLCLSSIHLIAQNESTVTAQIDTATIKIGEQIRYNITVETDSLNIVSFPEDQTFSPVEMVEALKIDTTKNKDRVTLQRIYALTQFDSGAYTIPQQRIAINEQPFFTDSFKIKVVDVVVDTTKQKMYDIKPLIQVEKSHVDTLKTILLIILALVVIAAMAYWYINREKPLTEEEKEALLPPYDRALLELKRLENSRYLIQDEYKKYYSELTDIVRSYLEEDANIAALESTTDQLIERLELLKDAGELGIDEDTLQQFKNVLQTADLVKFAKKKPPLATAEQDRKRIEDIVVKTKEALPEPTEEELLQNEIFLKELQEKKKKKRIYIAAASILGLLILGTAFSFYHFGAKKIRDTILGYPTKELLENEWVSSTYGFPPIAIETPRVLVRQKIELPEETKKVVKEFQVFGYGDYLGLFSVTTNSTTYNEQIEPDFEGAIGGMLNTFEGGGIKNIITKQDDFFSKSGVQGLKTYGSGQLSDEESKKSVRIKYAIVSFGGKGFMQNIIMTWEDGDDYAEQIVNRILASVDVKTQA